MFNYIRSDQLAKKPAPKKPTSPAPAKPTKPMFPMTPIEKKVNMPIDMQQIPQPDAGVTCIYPDMNIPPMTPQQPMPTPMPKPTPTPTPMPAPMPTPTPTPMPMPMPCSNCIHCMHYNMCMQPTPVPVSPAPKDPACDMSKHQDDMEVAYIKKMYPPLCQKIQKYVECELDQYDHELSPIYEMYPSKETINHMANCIYTDMKANMGNLIKEFENNSDARSPMGGSFYTLVYALLLNELYRKRMRRRLYR